MSAHPVPPAPRARAPRRGGNADYFRILADFAPVMIWLAAPDRSCVYFNPRWLEFTGRPLEDELGHGWVQSLHPEDRDAYAAAYAAAFDARAPFELEFRLRRADGEYRWLLGKGVPLTLDGELSGVVGTCLDITDRLLAEREAREARANAESATRARDHFLGIVSHELRSPLNGIVSWAHVLENSLRDPDPGVRRALAGIMTGVAHQVQLIDDLLDMTRAMSGNLRIAKQPVALLPLAAEAVESLRAGALDKGVSIAADLAIGEREVLGDHDRLRQILGNLVSNAIRFTPAGGTIRVSARAQANFARIEVSDDGAGIAPDCLPFVFDPLRAGERGPPGRGREGLGLGLALVQRLVELHGGHVSCESAGENRGAKFRVLLPLLPQGRSAPAAGAVRPAFALPSLAGIEVLLVDPEGESRDSLAALLAQSGARVLPAASAAEAIARLDGAARGDHVIVCDITIPGEDGYAEIERIRAWEREHGTAPRAAIALSAFTQREDRMRALGHGFHMHLAKPVVPAELILGIASIAHGVRV